MCYVVHRATGVIHRVDPCRISRACEAATLCGWRFFRPPLKVGLLGADYQSVQGCFFVGTYTGEDLARDITAVVRRWAPKRISPVCLLARPGRWGLREPDCLAVSSHGDHSTSAASQMVAFADQAASSGAAMRTSFSMAPSATSPSRCSSGRGSARQAPS